MRERIALIVAACCVMVVCRTAQAGKIDSASVGAILPPDASIDFNNDNPYAFQHIAEWYLDLGPDGFASVDVTVSPTGGVTEYQFLGYINYAYNGPFESFVVELVGPIDPELTLDFGDGDDPSDHFNVFNGDDAIHATARTLTWTNGFFTGSASLTHGIDVSDVAGGTFSLQYRLTVPEPALALPLLGLAPLAARGRRRTL